MANDYGRKRRKWLGQQERVDCCNCAEVDLIIHHNNDPEIPFNRRATIDHIVPMKYWAGSKHTKTNWQIMCEACNCTKGHK